MYVKLEDFWKEIEIQAGDIVFVSSDITKIGIDAKRHGENIDIHKWIDALIKAVGKTGTVIFPTYNWDFCKGIPFDYYKELISNYRAYSNKLDMYKIEKYISLYKNESNLSDALLREVF